jgi:hypothetical protein
MYGSLVTSFGTSYTTNGWYHGGINIHGSGVGHLNDPTSGLNGGPPSISLLSELPLGESQGCLPSDGWWA